MQLSLVPRRYRRDDWTDGIETASMATQSYFVAVCGEGYARRLRTAANGDL